MVQYGYYGQAPAQFTASDQSTLNQLAIFHFVYAALLGLSGLGVVAVVTLGFGLVASAGHLRGSGILAGGAFVAVLFVVAGILFVKAAVVCFSGFSLRQARHRTLTQIVAAFCCLTFPLGTILGIFTLMALSKPSVLALYQYREQGGVG
jgi:hypothetical protein